MNKYNITIDELLKHVKTTKNINENTLKYDVLDNDKIHEIYGEITICEKLIKFIESKKVGN